MALSWGIKEGQHFTLCCSEVLPWVSEIPVCVWETYSPQHHITATGLLTCSLWTWWHHRLMLLSQVWKPVLLLCEIPFMFLMIYEFDLYIAPMQCNVEVLKCIRWEIWLKPSQREQSYKWTLISVSMLLLSWMCSYAADNTHISCSLHGEREPKKAMRVL